MTSIDPIEVVNNLREKLLASGHTLDVSLPQIVVVGCQSAGKSSVLENVVGREFLPRGNDVVTRRPTVVQLEPSKELYATFAHKGSKRFTDFKAVMAEIQTETNREPGPVGFSSKPILLQIYAPNVLKLTVVDLPGLIKVAVGDQAEDAIKEVRRMVLEYIRPPNSIILAVTPANQDIANSDALEIAKTVDPKRIRTIGVLTKLDLMDAGTDARYILNNKKIPLKRGYVGVLNRSQQDIEDGKTIEYCIKKEKDYFESKECYRDIAAKMGSPYLHKMLHVELQKHIKLSLPSVRQELSQKLSSFRKELKELQTMTGYRCGGADEVRVYMIKLVQKFAEQLNLEIFGMSAEIKMKELTAGARISQTLYTDIQSGLKLPAIPKQEEMIRITINECGMRNCWTTPHLALEAVGFNLLSQYLEPLSECVQTIVDILYSCVEETIKTLEKYPNLRSEMLHLIRRSIEDSAFETKEILDKHMKAQMFFININHPDFKFPKVSRNGESLTPLESMTPVQKIRKTIFSFDTFAVDPTVASNFHPSMKMEPAQSIKLWSNQTEEKCEGVHEETRKKGRCRKKVEDPWFKSTNNPLVKHEEIFPQQCLKSVHSSGDSPSASDSDNEVSEDSKAISRTLTKNPFAQKSADLLIEMITAYLKIQQKQISDTAIKYISLFLVNEVLQYVKNGLVPIILGSANSDLLITECEKDFERMKEIKMTCDSLEEALNAVQVF